MKDKVIAQMLDCFSSLPATQGESFELALTILAWARLSAHELLPEELRLDSAALNEPSGIHLKWAEIGKLDPERYRPFMEARRLSIDPVMLRPALELAMRLTVAGVFAEAGSGETYLRGLPYPGLENTFPPEVATLLVELAEIVPGNTVYTPWDTGGLLSERAAAKDAVVYLETPSSSPIPELMSLLARKPFEVHHADPIRTPSAIDIGKPRRFDVAVAFPPLGMRYEGNTARKDWLDRFPEHTASGAVLSVRHLLAQASRRVVVAVPNSLLFSEGTELSLRLDLVEEGMVEAVIAMPSGLLTGSNVSFSILMLNPAGGAGKIQFISAETGKFHESISKARRRLVNLPGLMELLSQSYISGVAETYSVGDVLIRNAQLQVSRYVTAESSRRFEEMIDDAECILLQDLVQTVRPMPIAGRKSDMPIDVQEVGAADIPSFGYIRRPGRTIPVDAPVAEKSRDQFLFPFDIVLIVKGSVGKVGIIPEDVPPPGPGGWVACQSAMILRRNKETSMDMRALAVQLRSPMGQEFLGQIVSSASIPLITLGELDHLRVLANDQEQNQKAVDALEEEAELQKEIERLRRAQAEAGAGLWTPQTENGGQNGR